MDLGGVFVLCCMVRGVGVVVVGRSWGGHAFSVIWCVVVLLLCGECDDDGGVDDGSVVGWWWWTGGLVVGGADAASLCV